MLLKKNDIMDFIEVDDGNLVVFDPDTGDAHFIDEIGEDIISILSNPCDIDSIVKTLSEKYDTPANEIKPNVEDFICSLIKKKVVVEI
jgi:hypothetical protein